MSNHGNADDRQIDSSAEPETGDTEPGTPVGEATGTDAVPARPNGPVVVIGDWEGVLPKDKSEATRRHRRAQGMWRYDVLGWPPGPPVDARVLKNYPTLPNYIPKSHHGLDAETSGVNLMSREAREYAEKRLPTIDALDGKAETNRLYRNLLSSQPLAFSVAGELRSQPDATVAVLRDLTQLSVTGLAVLTGDDSAVPPERKVPSGSRKKPRPYQPLPKYTLDRIEAEWFPPRWAHTQDKSGFDIAACVDHGKDRRALVSIEVKYTDTFSKEPVEWSDRYAPHLDGLGLDESSTASLVAAGCSQVLRQVMITASVARRGLVPGIGETGRVNDAVAVVLARDDDDVARLVVEALNDAVGSKVPVLFWGHRQFLTRTAREPALAEWSARMTRRYLHEAPA